LTQRSKRPAEARAHQLDVFALKRDHLGCRICPARRIDRASYRDEMAGLFEMLAFRSNLTELNASHCVLERGGFDCAAIDDGLALAVLSDAIADRLLCVLTRTGLNWATRL